MTEFSFFDREKIFTFLETDKFYLKNSTNLKNIDEVCNLLNIVSTKMAREILLILEQVDSISWVFLRDKLGIESGHLGYYLRRFKTHQLISWNKDLPFQKSPYSITEKGRNLLKLINELEV